MLETIHIIILAAGLMTLAVVGWAIYLFLIMHKTIKAMMEYHCDFAGSHEQLRAMLGGVRKDMNTVAAAVADDRMRLRHHDEKVQSLVVCANEILSIMKRQNNLPDVCDEAMDRNVSGGDS